MDSTNDRKRNFETALEEEFSDDRQTKRPRLFEEDFQSDLNVLETASQPVLPGFVLATQPGHAGPISSSAPPNINEITEKMDPVNSLTVSLVGAPFDSSFPHAPEYVGPVNSISSPQAQGLVATATRTARDSAPGLTKKSTLEGGFTAHQTTCSPPEMPPFSFIVQGSTDPTDESSTNVLGPGVHPQANAPSQPIQLTAPEGENEIDAAAASVEPSTAPSQAVSELQADNQIRVESPLTTPIPTFRLPSQVVQREGTATPPKSALPSSSPLSTMASSPFGSPKSITKEKNPFGGVNSQQSSANVDEVPPPEVPHGDTAKPIQPPEAPARSKKENNYPQQKGEGSDSGLKPHEASSNLSKSSPSHPSMPSQHRSAKKIRTPFRSPLFSKTLGSNQQQHDGEGKTALPTKSKLSSTLQLASSGSELKKRGALSRIKGTGTSAARAAFKSPLRAGPSTTTGVPKLAPSVFSSSHKGISRNDPVQNRLQLLRRAVKIKESGEDEKLEALVGKWREVAKEVAWELWGVVKEGNVGEGIESRIGAGPGSGGRNDGGWGNAGFGAAGGEDSQQNWGWATGAEEDTAEGSVDRGKGEAKEEEKDEEPKVEKRSMGAMLRQLGIAQETLGWDEEEGDFTEIAA